MTYRLLLKRFGRPGLLLVPALLVLTCSSPTPSVTSSSEMRVTEDSIIGYNRQLVSKEAQEIDDFISRYHWTMNITETGVRYMIYRKGKGREAAKGKKARIRYTVRLINGDLTDPADPVKSEEIVFGKKQTVNGLEEGVLLMREGDHAKLIIPSHLAFGLLGDLKTVPLRSVLVYDLELVGVE